MAGQYGLRARILLHSTVAASTEELIVELTNIGDLSMTADDIDVTSHNNRIKQYLKGQVELGEVPFSGNFLSSQADDLLEHLTAEHTTQYQRVVVPGQLMVRFPGYLKAYGFGVPMDGKVGMTGAIKITDELALFASTTT